MHVFAFLLAVVGVALSLCYSGVSAMIVANGADLSWLKNFGSLDPKTMCVVASSALAALGALLLLFRKKVSSLLLLAAAGISLYCEFGLKIVYPYVRASAVLFAAAGLKGMRGRGADEEYGTEEYVGREPEMADPASATALDSEVKEELAAAEEELPAGTESRAHVWGFLLALAAAGYTLWQSGMWPAVREHFGDLEWYKNLLALDARSLSALAAAALALLGGLLALTKRAGGTLFLTAAAVVCAAAHLHWDVWFPASWGAFVLCLAAGAVSWPAAKAGAPRVGRRYTSAYVFAFIFALAAVAVSLYQSGAGGILCEKCRGGVCLAALGELDTKTLCVAAAAALGLAGGLLALCGLRFSSWLLLTAMFISLGGELIWAEYYTFSWTVLLLYALSTLLSGALVRADEEMIVRKLPLSVAVIAMMAAAGAGGAAMWYYGKGVMAEKFRDARANDPAYQQIAEEVKAKDARIAETDGKVREQMGLVAEREQKIAELTAVGAAKDEEIEKLTAQGAERDGQIAALNARLEQAKADLGAAQAKLNRKFIYLRGSNNVRSVPNADKGSKVIGRLSNETAEVVGTQGSWYQVKGSFGAGWVSGRNAVKLDLER